MTPSCAELGETCAATTVALGIVVFVSATYAAATFRPVMPILIWIGVAATRDATLAKCRCVEARAEKNVLYHSAGVVDTRHFAKIRVSQGDLRSKINRHETALLCGSFSIRLWLKNGNICNRHRRKNAMVRQAKLG